MKDLDQLVDWENGLISPEIFSDQEIFDLEIERIFGRAWLLLAHESQFTKPGDYFTTVMGTDPVLVVKQSDGSIGAFINFCRHRGMKVCNGDAGNTKAFTCSYHGWAYGIDGSLASVPNFDDAYDSALDRSKWGLIPVPKLEIYKGLIFGCLDPDAPTLESYLGAYRWYLDMAVDRLEGGAVVLGGVQKWHTAANWKLAAEQMTGDTYHGSMTHLSFTLAMQELGDPSRAQGLDELVFGEGRQLVSRHGHGANVSVGLLPYYAQLQHGPAVAEFYRETIPKSIERLGKVRATSVLTSAMFPSVGLGASAGSLLRTWIPRGPNAFDTYGWLLVDRDAPPEVRRELAAANAHNSGPGSAIESDDQACWASMGENFMEARYAKRFPLNYQMQLGRELGGDPEFHGRVNDRFMGEAPLRAWYRRWLEFMTSAEWPVVDEDIPMTEVPAGAPAGGR